MATTPIKLKRSHTQAVIPDTSDLIAGEVALNTVDKKFYVRDGSSQVVTLANHYATDFDVNVVTFKVTVATSTSAHAYHGTGSSNKYKINGVFSPYLKLIPRITYRFDQSDSSNSTHPLLFYYDSGKATAFTTGVTTNGTPGSAGAYTQIIVSDTTPPVLHYQCSAHANMGWAVTTSTRNFTGFDTDDLSEGSTNLYFTNARAQTQAQAVSINNVSEDSTPELGGTLSTNGNQIQLSQTSGVAIRTSGNLATSDLTLLRASASTDGTYGFDVKYIGSRSGNANSFALEMHNQAGTNVEAITVYQDGKVGINNTAPSSVLDVGGDISTTGNFTLTSTDAGSSAAPIIELNRDSSSPADADYLGQIKFKGDDDGGSSHVYAKITGKIQDASAGTEDGLIEFANVRAGSNTITARLKSDKFELLNSMDLEVAGNTTLTGTLNGHTIPGGSGTIALTSDIGSTDVSGDSTPQLGGDLDVNGNAIVSASNGNIAITPNGSGSVIIDGLSHPQADGNAGQVLKTDGSGQLAFASVSSLAGAGIQNVSDDSSPQLGGNLDVVTHSIVTTSNRDINLTPNGSGKVVVGTNGIEFGDGTTQTSAGATTGFSIAMATALG